MGKITNVKLITENVIIAEHKFALISFDIVDMTEEEKSNPLFSEHMFGTIDYDFIDETGKLARQLSLADLWAAITVVGAVEQRKAYFAAKRTIEKLKSMGWFSNKTNAGV